MESIGAPRIGPRPGDALGMRLLTFLLVLSLPSVACAVTCDGTELICLPLTSASQVTGAGGVVVGGSFDAAGFTPANQGGIDFAFPANTDLTEGFVEFDIEGLLPVDAAELAGGKVSLFSFCGEAPDDNEYIGFQKMPPDYRDGHILRYGMDDDGLADNWDAVVITGAGFGCFYSIASWQPGGVHHIEAEWGPSGITTWIDGINPCGNPNSGGGNGDTFDPALGFMVLGNRCQHYANQQPVAALRNLRVVGNGTLSPPPPPPPPGPCDEGPVIEAVSLSPASASGSAVELQARYAHCAGGEAFRVAQMWVGQEPDPQDPSVHVGFGEGAFGYEGGSCLPGEDAVLTGEFAALDCSRSVAAVIGDELRLAFALEFDVEAFGGLHEVWFDGKGGDGDPEPRIGWTLMGTFTVEPDPAGDDDDDDDSTDEDPVPELPSEDPSANYGLYQDCACWTGPRPDVTAAWLLVLGVCAWRLRRRATRRSP